MTISYQVIVIIGMAVVTLANRYLTLAFVSHVQLPHVAVRALKFAPASVLTALIVPLTLMPSGTLSISLSNASLIGALMSGIVAWRSRSVLMTLGLGFGTFLLWRWLVVPML